MTDRQHLPPDPCEPPTAPPPKPSDARRSVTAATVERSEREQILEAFYDSITGILFLHDEGRMGHTSVLGEVRHSTQRCEEQLAEIEDAEVRALSEEDDHAVA